MAYTQPWLEQGSSALSAANQMRHAVFTLVTASTFFDESKNGLDRFFDAHQLVVRLDFDVDIKKPAVNVKKNVTMPPT